MLADLDETIKQLLMAEMPIRNGEIDVNFDQPKREWSARLTKPTVNFFLYDVRQNVELRQFQWERVNGNGRPNVATLKRPPLRIDCHYMITTWAAEPEDEHRLLTRTMLTLFRFAKLPTDRLYGKLEGTEYDISTKLASHDKLTNAAEIWSALDNELRPSISYLLTMTLDPWTPIEEPMVRSLSMKPNWLDNEPAEADALERPGQLQNGQHMVAGTVRVANEETAVPQAQVALANTGYSDTTDENGRYILRGLPTGTYTFLITTADGQQLSLERPIPAPDGNYDFDVELVKG
jgi:hypothetical protein